MEIPYGNIVTAIIAVVSLVIGNRLAYSRTNRERIWDLRRQAYGVILSELAQVERICDSANEYMAQCGELEYFHSNYSRDHDADIRKHMTIANKSFSDDYLILSYRFVTDYEQLKDTIYYDDPNEGPPEVHDRFEKAIRQYRPILLAQARAEMEVKTWRWRLREVYDAIRNGVRRRT